MSTNDKELDMVVKLLGQAKTEVLELSRRKALAGEFRPAQRLLEAAETIHGLVESLSVAGFDAPSNPGATEAVHTYPRFEVDGDSLVKIAQQRGGQGVYRHSVPHKHFDVIMRLLGDMAEAGADFDARDVVRQSNQPDYYTYIVLAALKKLGLVETPKKGVHRFTERARFKTQAASVWQRLAMG
jgi:hypothetical protein